MSPNFNNRFPSYPTNVAETANFPEDQDHLIKVFEEQQADDHLAEFPDTCSIFEYVGNDSIQHDGFAPKNEGPSEAMRELSTKKLPVNLVAKCPRESDTTLGVTNSGTGDRLANHMRCLAKLPSDLRANLLGAVDAKTVDVKNEQLSDVNAKPWEMNWRITQLRKALQKK